jgi:transketolase
MIDGTTEQIMGLEPFADKWRAFGFNVIEADGHDFVKLGDAIDAAQAETAAPTVIIAHTVKGKGVDFMENQVKWHYGGLDTDARDRAKASVDLMYQ